MRKLMLSLAAAATMSAAFLMPSTTNAAVGTASAIHPAIIDTSVVDEVRHRRRCHQHRNGRVHCWRVSHQRRHFWRYHHRYNRNHWRHHRQHWRRHYRR